jgi:GNAT superfamily N-acetyltransferase
MSVNESETGTVTLIDGALVDYRFISASDVAALQRFHARLSNRSIYYRFFRYQPTLGDVQARYFTELDGINRVALVALDPIELGEIAGVIRFERDPETDRAEYAAVIADRWQGRGLGMALTRRLIEIARSRGVCTLYAHVLPDNARMLNLFRDLHLPERVIWDEDVERVELDLCAPTDLPNAAPNPPIVAIS